ncbi:ribonuclease M5 [Bacillus sp. FJAT-44742]|uniref:ribonuclease M5 n=1 Tax=Bacillus sp. FJAT-44742 TaxID=2014005 RepID=UPI000C23EC7E|nr:ribonuclease M5 [Bacillus sp. FJAT-44742]
MKIKECIVVEGKDDTTAIKQAVDADTIETNGSAVSPGVLKRIKLAMERRGVIVFTDPDTPGDRIRRIVSEAVPGCKHAFLPKRKALSQNKGSSIGVEHASPEAIREALAAVRTESEEQTSQTISQQDLMDAGLLAGPFARKRRERLGEELGIGYANGKQLLKRLEVFCITEDEFARAVMTVIEEEDTK